MDGDLLEEHGNCHKVDVIEILGPVGRFFENWRISRGRAHLSACETLMVDVEFYSEDENEGKKNV